MKERPIIFNAEMVRAILDEKKTVTRRVIKPRLPFRDLVIYQKDNIFKWSVDDKQKWHVGKCPYGVPGDLLYVRETFAQMCKEADPICWCDEEMEKEYHYIEYKADTGNKYPGEWDDADKEEIEMGKKEGWLPRWKPSIHMPKKFARIWLEVKDVRVERVQDIDFLDCIGEGIELKNPEAIEFLNTCPNEFIGWGYEEYQDEVIGEFKQLWDKINKPRGYSWESNPWVWVVEFERIEHAKKTIQ